MTHDLLGILVVAALFGGGGLLCTVRMITLAVCMVLLALSGCVAIGYETPDGARVTYTRVGSTKIDGLAVHSGETTVELSGYGSEGSALVGAAVTAAVHAAAP